MTGLVPALAILRALGGDPTALAQATPPAPPPGQAEAQQPAGYPAPPAAGAGYPPPPPPATGYPPPPPATGYPPPPPANDGEPPPQAAAGYPSGAMGSPPPPPRPVVPIEALRSPRDPYGIPQGVYLYDTELVGYRTAMEDRAARSRTTGGVVIGAGVAELALATLFFVRGHSNAEAAQRARDNGELVVSDPSSTQYVYGGLFTAGGIATIIYGAVLLQTRPDPTPLQQFFHERYGSSP